MTFKPTSKRPGIWPGKPGGHQPGVVAAQFAADVDKRAGPMANLKQNGDKFATLDPSRHRAPRAFGVPNGTIPGLVKTTSERITEQFEQRRAIHVRGLARGKR